MRVALISDIHANLEGLKAVLGPLEQSDAIICLGDITGYYCQVNEVIELVRALGMICVRGNHDDYVLNGCGADSNEAVRFGVDYARSHIRPEHRDWLASLPLLQGIVLGNRTFLLAHGSPWRPLTDYLYPDLPAIQTLNEFDFDVIAFGQTHRRLLRNTGRPLLLNPGSVGQARDCVGRACAAMLDTTTMHVESFELPYDAGSVVALARANGAGAWAARHQTD